MKNNVMRPALAKRLCTPGLIYHSFLFATMSILDEPWDERTVSRTTNQNRGSNKQRCSGAGTRGNGVPTPFSRSALK